MLADRAGRPCLRSLHRLAHSCFICSGFGFDATRRQLGGSWSVANADARCSPVDENFVRPVASGMRANAVARLQQVSAIELSERDAARLLGLRLPQERPGALATVLTANEIGELEKAQSDALDRRIGSWSRADDDRLAELKSLLISSEISLFKPFLVRAVGKARSFPRYYEWYSVVQCGDQLGVHYTSPREPPVRAQRHPIVVLLEANPREVLVARFVSGPHPWETIAFGFDKLNWQTTIQTARRMFPALAFAPDYRGMMSAKWGPPWIATQDFGYAGCNFRLALRFIQNRLDSLTLTSVGDPIPCRDRIERELNDRYSLSTNEIVRPLPSMPGPRYGAWIRGSDTPELYITYDFAETMTIRFGASTLGRRQRQEAVGTCASITLRYLPISRDEGVSSPLLQPQRPAFECDYPAISLRLQEQGAVQLAVQVRADGTVADAQVLEPSRRPRLDAAAQKIATQRWTFTPAMKDGQAVDSEVRMEVNFALFPDVANDR